MEKEQIVHAAATAAAPYVDTWIRIHSCDDSPTPAEIEAAREAFLNVENWTYGEGGPVKYIASMILGEDESMLTEDFSGTLYAPGKFPTDVTSQCTYHAVYYDGGGDVSVSVVLDKNDSIVAYWFSQD